MGSLSASMMKSGKGPLTEEQKLEMEMFEKVDA